MRTAGFLLFMLCALAPVLAAAQIKAPTLAMAGAGKAAQPVVIGATASDTVKTAAQELVDMLTRISGAPFTVEVGDGTRGLAVGVASDFPAVKTGLAFDAMDPAGSETYLLRTHKNGAYLIGASPEAARNGVWDFLARLGYRLYFPTDTWEVVPQIPELKIAVDDLVTPDYLTREAPRGAPWSDRNLWARWRVRNRMISSFNLSTGHAYDGIIKDNKAAFDAHPEYLGLVKGKRGGNKFCISNPGLRALVVDYAVRTIKAHPQQDSISMEPSDGGGWCTCDACAAMGSVSDRVVTLANEVAVAINKLGLGEKYVAFYGYNEQSPPPTIDVDPRVVVNLATSFIRGGHTIDTMIAGWKAKKAVLGIREYHDVFTWSHDLPRSARGGNIDYLQRTIPHFYANGARFMNSENSDSWGANGLGYWLTLQLLWDTDNAGRVDALIDDFVGNAFGKAKEPMRGFYTLINRDRSLRTSEDVVARLYRFLAEAKGLEPDPKVQARLNDLVLYTRYLELYYAYRDARGAERQQGFEQIWRHAYRMRDRLMLSTVAICSREKYRDKAVTVPAEAAWNVPEGKNPWKSSAPFTEEEIKGILQAGIAANQVSEPGFQTVEFSDELTPASALGLTTPKPGTLSLTGRGTRAYLVWLDKPGEITLKVTGGLIAHYRDRGNVKLNLFSPKNVMLDAVAHDESVPPDGQPYTVTLKSPYDGLHTLQLSDGSDMTALELPAGLPLTVVSSIDKRPPALGSRWSLYFYVPKGTTVVGGYTDDKTGKVLDGTGKPVFDFADLEDPGYFRIPVPAGADGSLWKFETCTGMRLLMTVPPYLARTAEELLLPAEVVKRDALKK
ncbi:MAG: DUF4838 domain-containing protein [Armatimonadota bacterium]